MNRKLLYTTLITISVLLYLSCASSGPLGGGPVDKSPPVIVEEKSTVNMATNFTKKDIVLYFDEYVEIKDLVKELAVSPPLTYRLQAKSRGKKVVLSFNEEEVLKENVTYIINMGNSIRDFRAGNILENYRFVFSTGAYIDSLSISGTVQDMNTGKPVEKAIVMVYDELQDSVVIEKRPFYFTKTDKSGNFILENIKSDTFRVYASNDLNANYVFNLGEESIGFVTNDVILDTASITNLLLELSTPTAPIRMLKYTNEVTNTVDFIYNNPILKKPNYFFDQSINSWSLISKDTLRIWYESGFDSVTVTLPNVDTITLFKKDKSPKQKLKSVIAAQSSNYREGDTLILSFNAPIMEILSKDSTWLEKTNIVETKLDSTIQKDTITEYIKLEFFKMPNGYEVGVVPTVTSNEGYKIRIDKGTFTDFYGRSNDSLYYDLLVANEDELSEVIIKMFGFDTIHQSFVKIFSNSKTYFDSAIIDLDTLNLTISRFIPEIINVEVITDVNKNGLWDAANIWGRIPSEMIFKTQISAPKPNWTVEEEIDLLKTPNIPSKEKPDSKNFDLKNTKKE